ncbi:efflux RND transporter periplasmic adaptor subunit [Tropicimonas isoalkanivorans]|uniref:Membrane fusion protein, multidrug efflux system n=1 Tax=Tropicimonas isoalkanivorans TaxID=441112 RepID=A0A1I1HLT9_9RHOB|nr:efflux RND transporter periplasmic adaptor subunit [Tropicimonas isoalkanivorans]SFC24796.1 membrane fusion protein, multidrug efflux system [Tropicimonas isoalkanivorans]
MTLNSGRGLLAALGLLAMAGSLPTFAIAQQAGQEGTPQAVPVVVAPVEMRPVAGALDVVGKISAIDRVDIQARVEGFLQDVSFEEGGTVAEGDVLFRIEPDEFEAAVTQAQGQLDAAVAQQSLAQVQLDRAQQLLDKKVDSQMTRDQAKAAYDSAVAEVKVSEGALRSAQINLGYTTITAPVAGVVGRAAITKGNVVGPASGPLTTIVSQDPIHALFQISETDFRNLRDRASADPDNVKVTVGFSDGTEYDQTGSIDFIDATVNQSTDTILGRAQFPNADGVLRDGQLVRVKLESGTPEERALVAQGAIIADQGGLYVFVVEDGKAARRTIKIGNTVDTDVVVRDGLAEGDMVIIDGLERVRPGAPVLAQPAPDAASSGQIPAAETEADAAPAAADDKG